MVMIFAHPKVRAYLLEHGIVYTYRKHHTKTEDGIRPQVGKDWATDRRTGNKIADIYITAMEPTKAGSLFGFLSYYVEESGFDTIAEWIRAIKEQTKNKPPKGWIYKVTLRNSSGSESK